MYVLFMTFMTFMTLMNFITFMAFKTFMTQENLIFDILQPAAFRKYSTYACVVNVIHAKVLPGSVPYIEH